MRPSANCHAPLRCCPSPFPSSTHTRSTPLLAVFAASANVVNQIQTFTYIFMRQLSNVLPPGHAHNAHNAHNTQRGVEREGEGGDGGRCGRRGTVLLLFFLSFYIFILCYFCYASKCGFYVFVYGKIREMAFTHFTWLRCQRLQLWSLHTICQKEGCSTLSTHWTLDSFSTFN